MADFFIADLQKIPEILWKRGYSNDDIQSITNENLICFLQNTLQNK